jgi:hypothetical protein
MQTFLCIHELRNWAFCGSTSANMGLNNKYIYPYTALECFMKLQDWIHCIPTEDAPSPGDIPLAECKTPRSHVRFYATDTTGKGEGKAGFLLGASSSYMLFSRLPIKSACGSPRLWLRKPHASHNTALCNEAVFRG